MADSIADADDPVEAVITDDATQAAQGRYGWLSLIVAGLFGLIFAYFVWSAISNLFTLPASFADAGLGGIAIPWWVLILRILVPFVVFAIAVFVGRRQHVGRKAVIFVVSLAVTAGLTLSLQALTTVLLVQAISTPAG